MDTHKHISLWPQKETVKNKYSAIICRNAVCYYNKQMQITTPNMYMKITKVV